MPIEVIGIKDAYPGSKSLCLNGHIVRAPRNLKAGDSFLIAFTSERSLDVDKYEIIARAAISDLVGVRASKWARTAEELQNMVDGLASRGVDSSIEKNVLNGSFAVYKAVKRDVAERMGWL